MIAENDDDLVRLIAGAIRKTNPPRVEGLTPERVDSMVRKGIEKARSFGLKKAEDIGVFTALMFEISPQFADEPSIAEVLADTAYTPKTASRSSSTASPTKPGPRPSISIMKTFGLPRKKENAA